MRMKKYILLIVLFFPLIPYTMSILNESNALIWIALDTVYYYPVAIVANPLFKKIEMGLIIPSIGGRVLAAVLYGIFLLLLFKTTTKKRSKTLP